jgi:hypothetical protein
MGVGEGQELTSHKVTRMCRHEVEKASFRFRVAEGLQCVDMDRGDVHGTKIRAQLFGFVERTARPRRAYPGRETGFATGRLPCSDTQHSGVTDEVGGLRRA